MYLLCSSCLHYVRKQPEQCDDFVIMLRWACSEEMHNLRRYGSLCIPS